MSRQDSRIIPPGQLGSPFSEPSGSMRGEGDVDIKPFANFFSLPAAGSTDIDAVMARLTANCADRPDARDRLHFVITDGEPSILDEEGGAERIKALHGRFQFFQPLPLEGGAEHESCGDVIGCIGLNALSGTGLLAVPSADDLVKSAVGKCDQPGAAGHTVEKRNDADQCCGCGGCAKQDS